MPKMIFVNLPVADVARSTAFYEAIGCINDTSFCKGPQAAMLTWSETISIMVLDRAFYQTFTSKQIADAHKTSSVLLALSHDSREAVDRTMAAALAAGGKEPAAVQDMGFMYNRTFEDPDGHTFEPMWMDVDAAIAAMNQSAEAAA